MQYTEWSHGGSSHAADPDLARIACPTAQRRGAGHVDRSGPQAERRTSQPPPAGGPPKVALRGRRLVREACLCGTWRLARGVIENRGDCVERRIIFDFGRKALSNPVAPAPGEEPLQLLCFHP